MSYYERNYEFLSQKELISQVQSHYTGQALKQLYVLVLGLDVIGNPYGLVIGLKKGVEDLFYEPFQVCIHFIRSLIHHSVVNELKFEMQLISTRFIAYLRCIILVKSKLVGDKWYGIVCRELSRVRASSRRG